MQASRSSPLTRTQPRPSASSLPSYCSSSHPCYQARIVETGATKVAQLYTKLVAEASSGIPPGSPEFTLISFDPSLRLQLIPIVSFLRTLPLPATHPNHPAAIAIQSTLRDAQRGYGEMRGSWSRKCLEPHAKRLLERSETVDGVLAGREVGAWVQNMLTVAEVRPYISVLYNPQLTGEIRRNTIFCPISHQSLHHRWSPPHSVLSSLHLSLYSSRPYPRSIPPSSEICRNTRSSPCLHTRRYLNQKCIGKI